jgi:hypothetical protein
MKKPHHYLITGLILGFILTITFQKANENDIEVNNYKQAYLNLVTKIDTNTIHLCNHKER